MRIHIIKGKRRGRIRRVVDLSSLSNTPFPPVNLTTEFILPEILTTDDKDFNDSFVYLMNSFNPKEPKLQGFSKYCIDFGIDKNDVWSPTPTSQTDNLKQGEND